MDYWYNAQIRNYIAQFIAMFNVYQIKTGVDDDGVETYINVPARYGNMSRQVGHILRDNSSNMLITIPMITCYMTALNMAPDRRQNPTHVSTVQVTERYYDRSIHEYTGDTGQSFSVERYMPVPYDLTMEVAILTSNTDHKLQVLEQILTAFNPSVDLQTSSNPIDWTALTIVELQDSITLSERSQPVGTDEPLDIARLSFRVPIWLSPPAKVKRQRLINQIITNISTSKIKGDDEYHGSYETRLSLQPNQHRIRVAKNTITLLTYAGIETDSNGELLSWKNIFNKGNFEDGHSMLCITNEVDKTATPIRGTVKMHPTHVNELIWTPDQDTFPKTTINNVLAVIDPHDTYPNQKLPPAENGQRYMLVNEIGNSPAWDNIIASANDIIERINGKWCVVFHGDHTKRDVVRNTETGKLYEWVGDGWAEVVDGEYFPGYWWVTL